MFCLCLQYFPGRPMVMNLLKSLNTWLKNQTDNQISYEAFRQVLDNTAQVIPSFFLICRVLDLYR